MSSINEDQDQSNHTGSMGDLTTMTIESLRTRLLSERAISKSARQRADDLAKRVVELEEQLRIVSMQRKKAERATADVLAILESNGISDASDAYDSSSDREMSVCESKLSNESGRRKEAFTDSQEQRNDQDTNSSSEIDSSSTAGSLSWKSNKDSPNYHDKKKNIESLRRRSSSFASSGSLQKRLGKSCRRIRRKEMRAQTDELCMDNIHGIHEDSLGADHQDLSNSPSISPVALKKEPETHKVVDVTETPVSEASGTPKTGVDTANLSLVNEHAQDRDLESIVQSQQTVGYETEEKAKPKWKDKFKENNSNVSESCDPDRSIVSKDRGEIRVPNESVADPITSPNEETQSVAVESSFSFQPEVLTNSPDTPQFYNGQKHDKKNGSMSTRESSSSDFALPKSMEAEAQIPPSYVANGESSRNINELTSMTEKSSNDLNSVLDALQLAKLSLKHKLSAKSVSEDGFSVKDSFPATKTSSIMPIGCPPGLFRLPVDFQFPKPSVGNYSRTDSTLSSARRDKSSPGPYWEPRPNAFAGDMVGVGSSMRYADTPSTKHTIPPHIVANDSETRSRTYAYTPQYMDRGSRTYSNATPPIDLRSGIPPTGISSSFSTRNIDFAPKLDENRVLFPTERLPPYLDPHLNAGYPFSSNYNYSSYPSSPDVTTPQLSLSERFSRDVRGVELGMPSNARFSLYSDQIRPNLYK